MVVFLCVALLFGYIYEDADSLLILNDSLVMCGYHQYNLKVHLNNNAKLKVRLWNGIDSTGKIILQAPLIHIHGSSIVQGTGFGYSGGTNTHPDGYGPGYGHAGVSGGGGGAGYGGAGGQGGDVNPGAGGVSYGNMSDTTIDRGSGGGAGRLGLVDGFGGNGGALVYLRGHKILIDTASVLSNGMRGNDGSYEAGGGGAGGGIKICADTVLLRNAILSAKGGAGGDAAGGGGGGAGGGRIKIFNTFIDTVSLSVSVSGGNGGTGGYGNGQSGSNGTLYFGPLVSLEEVSQDSGQMFFVQPHITTGGINVYCVKSKSVIAVYNISGRCVKRLSVTRILSHIDLSDMSEGVYFIREQHSRVVEKIVLVR